MHPGWMELVEASHQLDHLVLPVRLVDREHLVLMECQDHPESLVCPALTLHIALARPELART